MLRLKSFLQQFSFSRIISGLCYLPLFIVLFVPTTSFLPSVMPVPEWYKLCLIAAIILAVVSGRFLQRDIWKGLLDKGWLFWLMVFIAWVCLLWICQADDAIGDSDLKYWLIPAGLILLLWIASSHSWKGIAACFLIVGLINSLAGFGFWLEHHFDPAYRTFISSNSEAGATGLGWYYLIGGGIPPTAGLRDTVAINGMADLLFWPFMILIGYVAIAKRKWLPILGIVIITLGIFATYSRSTAVVMALGIAFFFFLRKKNGINISRRKAAAFLALIALVPIVMLFFLPRSLVGSFFSRFDMWNRILIYLQKFPNTYLTGGGFPRIVFYPFEVWDTHSTYLYLVVAYGIPGLLLFLVFFGSFLREGWKNISNVLQPPMDAHAAAALSALACFLIRGLVESQINEIDWRMSFVLFLAYAAWTIHGELPKPSPVPEAAGSQF
jgi:hypothetical protein